MIKDIYENIFNFEEDVGVVEEDVKNVIVKNLVKKRC